MIDGLPNILLSAFIVAAILMLLAMYCVFKINRLARNFLENLYESDIGSYRKMVGDRGSSWIERKADSITDSSLWWKLYRVIYLDGDGEYVINSKMQHRFAVYIHLMIASSVASLLIAVSVLVVGFTLAS